VTKRHAPKSRSDVGPVKKSTRKVVENIKAQGSVFAPRDDVYSLMPQWPIDPRLDKWSPIAPPVDCDLCHRTATWRHTRGALRCDRCPRPKK